MKSEQEIQEQLKEYISEEFKKWNSETQEKPEENFKKMLFEELQKVGINPKDFYIVVQKDKNEYRFEVYNKQKLQEDLDFLNSKNRELNSFEQGG